jgi:hypothetical protein
MPNNNNNNNNNNKAVPQEWTLVKSKQKAKSSIELSKTKAKDLRLVLVTSSDVATKFSPLALRNAFNQAFANKGVKNPVVNTITKSMGQNLVVTTTSQFSASYLIEKQAIWQHLVPFKSMQKDESWHKVVLHSIPTSDFNTTKGMELVIEEIKTFNKGLQPIGTPYWLTSADKRANQRAGSVVVSFATAEEANRAIRHRLFIAGISVRVEKFYATAPTTQCGKCQAFGHIDTHCKKSAKCKLCGEGHVTQKHACNTCNTQGATCMHLVPKCVNCKGNHTADHKACEVLIAIKSTKLN